MALCWFRVVLLPVVYAAENWLANKLATTGGGGGNLHLPKHGCWEGDLRFRMYTPRKPLDRALLLTQSFEHILDVLHAWLLLVHAGGL